VKSLAILFISLVLLSACEKERYDDKNPKWLDQMIQEMENNPYYTGSSIERYTWKNNYYYEFTIPLSSCLYCDVYNFDGDRIDWQKNDIDDYLANRTYRVLIWNDTRNTFR